jgi:hypothetical protein
MPGVGSPEILSGEDGFAQGITPIGQQALQLLEALHLLFTAHSVRLANSNQAFII